MGFLPEDPKQQGSLLAVILALAAGAAFYLYLFNPAAARILDMKTQLEDLTFQNELAETRIGNLQALRDRLEFGEREFRMLQKLVPAGSDVPEIYEAIATEAQALNLQLLSVNPTIAVRDSGAFFLRQEWLMQVEGEYHMVGQFLARVAAFDRIVRPQVTELSPSRTTPSGRQLVTASFGLETFVMPTDTLPSEDTAANSDEVDNPDAAQESE